MKYYSLNRKSPAVSFKEAVINGIAPDKGLYFPERIQQLPKSFFNDISHINNHEIAYEAIQPFVKDDIPKQKLIEIIEEVLNFDFPITEIEENVSTLELFHGPTMAFKDVGARFMSRCLSFFNDGNKEEVTVLVATSGDTGGAVANGFYKTKGVNVVILYPANKVSDIQERQLTTLGENIKAIKVNGSFDDCQEMVKQAFIDQDLIKEKQLTSANSINVARWLPQMFYYLFAYKQLKNKEKELVFSVPSGNFGNISAGILAQRLGMPVSQFIAATNINDTVPEFLRTKEYRPKASISTISNAMDVGDPSNFIRMMELYRNDYKNLIKNISSYSFTDQQTLEAIQRIYNTNKYITDPHGAVGYLGLKKYMKGKENTLGVFMETAHPIKFADNIEKALNIKLDYPEQIKRVLEGKKEFEEINQYEELKEFFLKA